MPLPTSPTQPSKHCSAPSSRLHAAVFSATLLGAALYGCGSDGAPVAVLAPDAGAPDASGDGAVVEGDYLWDLPPGFPKPLVPADNPLSKAQVELGRRLFYDRRLSANETQSCGSCHLQDKAFTDGRAQGLGSTGELHPRGPMALANIGYATTFTWANSLLPSLERQALLPLFGETPVELGMVGKEEELLARLRAEPVYADLFPRAYPRDPAPFSVLHVTQAIANFQRTVVSGRSAYDRYNHGDPTAMNESQKRGKLLFFSETTECFHCHGGLFFADSVAHEGSTFTEIAFHNTGLYNIDGKGAYPPDNEGIKAISGRADDMGRFKAPSLRNIALTAPYMHDGSIATLAEVIEHYAAGGRTIATGPYAGVGSKNPYKSELIRGFTLTAQEKADLIAFLESLTDDSLRTNPAYADPWPPR